MTGLSACQGLAVWRIVCRVQTMMNKSLVCLLFSLGAAVPAAAQYSARRDGDVIRLEDAKNQMVVAIQPSAGNGTNEFTVKGQNILRGIPVLAPWANRLDEQAFYANGRRYAFDMQLGNISGGAVPIHGFLTSTDQWKVKEVKADGTAAWVTSTLDVYKQPMWMKQFPFAHTIEMTHRLQDGVLQVYTKIANMAAEPMPVAIGFHPCYWLTDAPRADWVIDVPARTWWPLTGTKVPIGSTEPIEKIFPGGQGRLKDYNLDDVFDDLKRDAQGRAHVSVKGKQQQIEVTMDQAFRALVIFSPNSTNKGLGSQANALPNPPPAVARPAPAANAAPQAQRESVCFEPMAGITDGMNLAHKGLYKNQQYIAPNQTWEANFWVKPTGF